MNEIGIKIGNRTRKVTAPQSWDDLDARTALLFYNTLFTAPGSELTAGLFTPVKLISLTMHVLKVDGDFLAQWEADCLKDSPEHGSTVFLSELKEVIRAALAGLFDIAEDEDGNTTYAVKYNRTKNLWPSLSRTAPVITKRANKKPGKVTWYYSPKDALANLTLYELAYTFALYEKYVETRDEAFAHQLIASLYRPSRPETLEERESAWHGDRRQPLRRYEDKVADRAKMAGTLPTLTRRFLVFWFAGCREAIAQQYPKVFKRTGEEKTGANYGWGGLLLRLAETSAFGALDQTADQHFSNALTYLSMKEDERREQERAMDAAKRKRA